mmetsp:Transcript_82734/g.229652  ORF Transcript_82734/g.229652 Transcript_82734/m.229652 type:complete len:274 (+) Transcript_82734:168-989(+)
MPSWPRKCSLCMARWKHIRSLWTHNGCFQAESSALRSTSARSKPRCRRHFCTSSSIRGTRRHQARLAKHTGCGASPRRCGLFMYSSTSDPNLATCFLRRASPTTSNAQPLAPSTLPVTGQTWYSAISSVDSSDHWRCGGPLPAASPPSHSRSAPCACSAASAVAAVAPCGGCEATATLAISLTRPAKSARHATSVECRCSATKSLQSWSAWPRSRKASTPPCVKLRRRKVITRCRNGAEYVDAAGGAAAPAPAAGALLFEGSPPTFAAASASF